MGMTSPQTPAAPDFTHLARRPSERLAIVEYVLHTPNLHETDYLEWKSGYDLAKKPGAAATSKHLIGFANRDLVQAARHADGYAYLLLGLEPGGNQGVEIWDSADIENWLVRFVGRDLRYDADYVGIVGKQVLFLTVDPPRHGDPIYCLQQTSGQPGTGNTMPGGTVYVRHGGQTDVANASDIARLTARACAITANLDLRVEFDTSAVAVIGEHLLTESARDEFVDREKRRLYGSLPSRQGGMFGVESLGDLRSREEFRLEVAAYLEAVATFWSTVVVVDHIRNERSVLVPSIVNKTDQNFEDVVVELSMPFDIRRIYLRSGQAAVRLNPPEAPKEWGAGLLAFMHRPIAMPRLGVQPPEPELEEPAKGVTLVRFAPLHVRPHTSHRLTPLLLALTPDLAGATQSVYFRVTARNTPGQLKGDLDLVIPDVESDEVPQSPS